MPSLAGQWQVRRENGGADGPPPRDELSRSYEFSGVPTSDATAMLGIVCTLESGGLIAGSGSEPSRLSVNRRLSLYLRPLRLSHETPFVIEVWTADRSAGGKFDVRASPVGDSDTALFAKIGRNREDVATLLGAIMSGKDMTFALAYESEPLMQFKLQNDSEFKRLCEETYKRFVGLETEYQKARLQKAPSRQPP